MNETLKAASARLIVAADFKPTAEDHPREDESLRDWVYIRVMWLAQTLKGTGAYLKVNSALRACGYNLIEEIHRLDLKVFADLKLFDISETLSIDGALLIDYQPEIVTVACCAGPTAMSEVKRQLMSSEIIGVTVPTSFDDEMSKKVFGAEVKEAVMNLSELAFDANIDGLVCAPVEVPMLMAMYGSNFSYNTPGIRPEWSTMRKDDQNQKRVMLPADAIKAGATRIIVGRPITQNVQPFNAAMRTIEEIAVASTTT